MRKLFIALVLVASPLYAAPKAHLGFSMAAQSGGGHSVTLSWGASPDVTLNVAGQGYNVYEATATSGTCTGLTYGLVNTTLDSTALTYTVPVTPGAYCFYVTAVVNGAQSVPSNTVNPVLLPSAPGTLTYTKN